MGRDVIVEDVANTWNVQATGGDIGTDKNLDFVILEFLKPFQALVLIHIAMQCAGRNPSLFQGAIQGRDIALAVTENQCVGNGFILQQAIQNLALLAAIHLQQALFDRVCGAGRGRYGDFFWIALEFRGQLANFRRHGCGKHQGLAQRRHQGYQLFHIRNKAHIQHPVAFVDDQDFHVGQDHLAAFAMVHQTARCRDQHVNATVDLGFLLTKRHAANQQGHV